MMDPEILFEDQDLVVINKPAGMVVNDSLSSEGETVQQWMTARQAAADLAEVNDSSDAQWFSLLPDDFSEEYGSAPEIFAERKFLVHRLDKDTSGVLILAKNPGSMINVMQQFQKRSIEKMYQCLVHGVMPVKHDTIRLPIMRSATERQRFSVSPDGRTAETKYSVIAEYAFDRERFLRKLSESGVQPAQNFEKQLDAYQDGFALVNCAPKTGRTHQIRVHFSYLNHPLVGDGRYLGKRRKHLDFVWCHRHFLHACEVRFDHPRTGERLLMQAPLPPDLQQVLTYIEP